MQGWIYVFDHPCFAVTDKRGVFRIKGAAPGAYRVIFQQPDIRYATERNVTVRRSETAELAIHIRAGELRTSRRTD
jgi:hypothetical protein